MLINKAHPLKQNGLRLFVLCVFMVSVIVLFGFYLQAVFSLEGAVIFTALCLSSFFWVVYRVAKQWLSDYEQRLADTQALLAQNKEDLQQRQKDHDFLSTQYFMIGNAVLFASYRTDMTLIEMSHALTEMIGAKISQDVPCFIQDLFPTNEHQYTQLVQVLRKNRRHIAEETLVFNGFDGKPVHLSLLLVPFHHQEYGNSTFFTAIDVTHYKNNERAFAKLKQEEYDNRMAVQKQQATQVVAAQEQERERIARDIHDGIGQVLTFLKINLEAIDFKGLNNNAAQQIRELKKVSAQLIKDVRAVTFNLTPPELSDYGVIVAIERMTTEIAKLSNQNITFECTTTADIDLTSLEETNLYRVTQEAINNALKYASASYVLVRVIHGDGLLSILVEDDGKGFEVSKIKQGKKASGGMGLFFMEERIRYIGGRFFINSKVGEGTRVLINLPLGGER